MRKPRVAPALELTAPRSLPAGCPLVREVLDRGAQAALPVRNAKPHEGGLKCTEAASDGRAQAVARESLKTARVDPLGRPDRGHRDSLLLRDEGVEAGAPSSLHACARLIARSAGRTKSGLPLASSQPSQAVQPEIGSFDATKQQAQRARGQPRLGRRRCAPASASRRVQ